MRDAQDFQESHRIFVSARFRPEILERVLRVVRHRGFQVRAMKMEPQESPLGDVAIRLTVSSDRPVAFLLPQLRKLIDVSSVDLLHEERALQGLASQERV